MSNKIDTFATPTVKPRRGVSERRSREPAALPPLNPGDRLSRAEFERRYEAHPALKKAELVEGIVYMSSPVRLMPHGFPHFCMVGWLSVYFAATPKLTGGDNTTVYLDLENEVQPDALLRLDPSVGGRSRITDEGYVEGAPELVVEVAASSAAYDLHTKRRVYARSGVQEYLAFQMYEQEISWFVLREGVYELLMPDKNEVLCSEVFPGLWLDTAAFWATDMAKVLATLQQGLASEEHAAFVAHLHQTAI